MREYTKETCLYLIEALTEARDKLQATVENSKLADEEWDKVSAALDRMTTLINRLQREIYYS